MGVNKLIVAILFARADSIYKTIPGCDVYDIERDALNWSGGAPVIAHPPCRAWGQLRHMANPRPGEKELALWAVKQVRRWGGVLEHPKNSTLWPVAGLPAPGCRDEFGGWTLPIHQHWWGHRAEKATRLYIVGCKPADIPPIPPKPPNPPTHVISTGHGLRRGMPGFRSRVTDAEREHTPPDLARWLVDLARRCQPVTRRSAA
jgi:hypothetical protein